MGSWFNSKGGSIRKRQYYVWFLGSQESGGPPDGSNIPSSIEGVVAESRERVAHKVTVQVSEKGLKLIQTIPTVSKSGKMRMETAQDMNDAILHLIARSENGHRSGLLREQLFHRNHDPPPHQMPRRPREEMSVREKLLSEGFNGYSSEDDEDDVSPPRDSLRVARLHRALFHELKDRLLRKAQKHQSYRPHPFDLSPSPIRDTGRGRNGPTNLAEARKRGSQFISEQQGRTPRSKSSSRRDDTLLTSSTSGFGSDLSSPDERPPPPRASMTELRCFHPSANEDDDPLFPTIWHPSWSSNDRRSRHENERANDLRRQRRYASTDHLAHIAPQHPPQIFAPPPPREPRLESRSRPPKRERHFGDTVKVVAGRQSSAIGPRPPSHNLYASNPPPPSSGRPFHAAMRSNQNNPNWITRRRMHRSLDNLHFMQFPSSPPGSPEPMVPRRERKFSNFVDPSGRRYERSTNIGGWGQPRRASWYVPPNPSMF